MRMLKNNKEIVFNYSKNILQFTKGNEIISHFTFENTYKDFKLNDKGLPIFKLSDIKTFNVITQDINLLNELLSKEDFRSYMTELELTDFINNNIEFLSGENIKIITRKDIKFFQVMQKLHNKFHMLNVYFDKSVENDTIVEEYNNYKEKGEPFTRSLFQIDFNLNKKDKEPFVINFYKTDWYFSLEYLPDTYYGGIKGTKRNEFLEKAVYYHKKKGYFEISFDNYGLPLVERKLFDKFLKNEKNDLEEIHCQFINKYMIELLLHSDYTSFFNMYSNHKLNRHTNNLFDIEREVEKRFEIVSMTDRTSQEFLKKEFDKCLVKYSVYPEFVKDNVVSIEQVYRKNDNATVNNGFILKVTFKKFELYFKIDDTHTQGIEQNTEEMISQIKGYIEVLGKLNIV